MKTLFLILFRRLKCAVKGHDYGETVRDGNLTGWFLHLFTVPVTGDKMEVYKREFAAHRVCLHCQHVSEITGYDMKPTKTDAFVCAKPSPSNSPVRIIHDERKQTAT